MQSSYIGGAHEVPVGPASRPGTVGSNAGTKRLSRAWKQVLANAAVHLDQGTIEPDEAHIEEVWADQEAALVGGQRPNKLLMTQEMIRKARRSPQPVFGMVF